MKKENEVPSTEQKIMTKYDRKVQKKKEEEAKKKKAKIAVFGGIGILAAIILVVIGIVAISNVALAHSYVKVDGKNISKKEVDFYYYRTVNTNASTYANYYGLNMSTPLDQQKYQGDMTWKDFFLQKAMEEMTQIKALAKEAKKAGFKGDVDKEFDKMVTIYKEDAKTNSMSETEYYKTMFGSVKKDVEEYMKEYAYASLYLQSLYKGFEPSDEEIEKYYAEHKNDYDNVKYYVSTVSAEGVTIGQSSEEEIKKAMEVASNAAVALLPNLATQGELLDYDPINYQGATSSKVTTWLYDEARVANETTVVADESKGVCYAVMFVERYRNEAATADMRAVIVSDEKTKIEDVLNEYLEGDKTEDSFIKLANKYSEDKSAADGMYECVGQNGIDVPGLNEWLFDAEREKGDVTTFTNKGTSYLTYYVGPNVASYRYAVADAIKTEKTNDKIEKLVKDIKIEDKNKVLKYLTEK